jgi:ABC-type microcin C transport system permease subunit YejB
VNVLGAILDRIVLLIAVVAAGCIPSFIVQYRQRMGGRLDQVLADLSPFQAIADRYHGGSLAELIRYHLQSSDATFHQEGAALQSMVQAAEQLRAMLAALDTDLLHQCGYLLLHHDMTLLRATWAGYQPGFTLDLPSAVFALAVGVVLWAIFLGVWHGVARLLRALRSGASRPPARGPQRRTEPRLR